MFWPFGELVAQFYCLRRFGGRKNYSVFAIDAAIFSNYGCEFDLLPCVIFGRYDNITLQQRIWFVAMLSSDMEWFLGRFAE